MDLQQFLALEKQRLLEDRARLLHWHQKKQETISSQQCPAVDVINKNEVNIKCNKQNWQQTCNSTASFAAAALDNNSKTATYPATFSASNAHTAIDLYDNYYGLAQARHAPAVVSVDSADEISSLGSSAHELESIENHFPMKAAQQQKQLNLPTTEQKETIKSKRRSKDADDMEQWVSDAFYSYFPAYNNEYQKRQTQLRERQQENEQQLLKHQMLAAQQDKRFTRRSNNDNNKLPAQTEYAKSNNAVNLSNSKNKTDLEIIVNNPNYMPPKNSSSGASTSRSDSSTRHKLLQDLRHTNLSDSLQENLAESKTLSAELDQERKKNYQRELLQQIEEKRRSIELLIAKEQKQEEVLTKRLQEQLKTIKLEEQLEKEKLRAERVRFETEQNRLMRQHLLAKLENDSKLLNAKRITQKTKQAAVKQLENLADVDEVATRATNNNRVYQYFSNSAQHEYRHDKPLPAEVKTDLEIPTLENIENECFHLSDKVCPLCDAPLKNYESCCLQCQKKLSLKLSKVKKKESEVADEDEAGSQYKDVDSVASKDNDYNAQHKFDSFSLACAKCQLLYSLCPECLIKSDVCRACYRKRNVCMNCRRTLCSHCLDEVASGRNAERNHINEQLDREFHRVKAGDADCVKSFQVLEVNYANDERTHSDEDANTTPIASNNYTFKEIHNNLEDAATPPPPFSINIDKNSVFHADYNKHLNAVQPTQPTTFKILDKAMEIEPITEDGAEIENLQRMRKKTDNCLSRYLKNYGDLAEYRKRSTSESRNRSTQTTPNSLGRRDIVLQEQQNLSMPLLREMPKMTRQEMHANESANDSDFLLKQNNAQRRIDNLRRRWEVPAVQKYSISNTDPPVLTQLGAIRKQLQTDYFMESDV